MAIRIKNNTNGKELTLRLVDNWKEKVSQQSWQMDFPESAPQDRLIMRLSGQEMNISFTSSIYDSGSDLSNGDNIKTKDEQKQYVYGTGGDTTASIYTPNMSDTWTLTVGSEQFTCVLSDVSVNKLAGNPHEYEVNWSMLVGKYE